MSNKICEAYNIYARKLNNIICIDSKIKKSRTFLVPTSFFYFYFFFFMPSKKL